jgi:hypothetical protein
MMSASTSSSTGGRPPIRLTALPQRSPLAVLVAAQRSRTPVRFFEPRAALAATVEAAAQHLASACYAVDAYRRETGELADVTDEVRQAITALSRLSWSLLASAAPATTNTGTNTSAAPGIPGESTSADRGADHG